MSARELVVPGTSSQAPTRHRNHNGYLLRWDGEGLLLDPYDEPRRFADEAAAVFSGALVVAEDLMTVPVPARAGRSASRVGA